MPGGMPPVHGRPSRERHRPALCGQQWPDLVVGAVSIGQWPTYSSVIATSGFHACHARLMVARGPFWVGTGIVVPVSWFTAHGGSKVAAGDTIGGAGGGSAE